MIPEDLRGRADLLLDRYSAYYDVARCDEGDLFARAEFHSRGEKYFLVRNVNLWSVEDHEYVFFFAGERLTPQILERDRQMSIDEGMSRIRPGSNHRSSCITTVLLYDLIDDECFEAIKKIKLHRDFGFMLKGWMDYRIAAVDVSGTTCYNRAGRDVIRNLTSLRGGDAESR